MSLIIEVLIVWEESETLRLKLGTVSFLGIRIVSTIWSSRLLNSLACHGCNWAARAAELRVWIRNVRAWTFEYLLNTSSVERSKRVNWWTK